MAATLTEIPCQHQTHYGTIAPVNAQEPDGPTGWQGICGALTDRPSGLCVEHEQYWLDNYGGIPSLRPQ